MGSTKRSRSNKESRKPSKKSAVKKNINTNNLNTKTEKIIKEKAFYERSVIDTHFKNLTEETWTNELVKVSGNPDKLVFVKAKEPVTNFATTIFKEDEKLTIEKVNKLVKASGYHGQVIKKIKVDKTVVLEEITSNSLELAGCDAITKYARVNQISDTEFKLISTRIARLFEQNTLDWIKNIIFDFTYNTNMVKIYHEVFKKLKGLSEKDKKIIQQNFIKFINEDYNGVKLSYIKVLLQELAKDNILVNYCTTNLLLLCSSQQELQLLKEGLYNLLKNGKSTEISLKLLRKYFNFDSEMEEPEKLKEFLGTKFKVVLMKKKAA